MSSLRASRQHGFSLLEMLVAMVILAMSLGALYQSVSSSTRSVAMDEKYAYGVELANSLLADNQIIPLSGLSTRGETEGGFSWRVEGSPLSLAASTLPVGLLQKIQVSVSWQDGDSERSVVLNSTVAGQQ